MPILTAIGYRRGEVARPGKLKGVACRGSRASPTAAAATGPSSFLGRSLWAIGRAVRSTVLFLQTRIQSGRLHCFGGLDQMRSVAALLALVEVEAKTGAVLLNPTVMQTTAIRFWDLIQGLARILVQVLPRLGRA